MACRVCSQRMAFSNPSLTLRTLLVCQVRRLLRGFSLQRNGGFSLRGECDSRVYTETPYLVSVPRVFRFVSVDAVVLLGCEDMREFWVRELFSAFVRLDFTDSDGPGCWVAMVARPTLFDGLSTRLAPTLLVLGRHCCAHYI